MPDPQKAPDAYAAWQKAVTAPQKRLENPSLVKVPILHSPARISYANKSGESNRTNIVETRKTNIANTISAYSYNWSGYAVYDPANPFKTSLVYSYWNVPTAQQAFGQCNGTWDYSAQWVGIDGLGSNDVLQAGTEADAYCGADGRVPYYAAWIEWYPDFESVISNFVVKAGDVMFVEVWNTSATQGNAYLVDLTGGESMALSYSAPPGTALVGNSVEWVVERLAIG
jgi:Peptidase A4 family